MVYDLTDLPQILALIFTWLIDSVSLMDIYLSLIGARSHKYLHYHND